MAQEIQDGMEAPEAEHAFHRPFPARMPSAYIKCEIIRDPVPCPLIELSTLARRQCSGIIVGDEDRPDGLLAERVRVVLPVIEYEKLLL